MNANEYINGMAGLLRTTSAEYVKEVNSLTILNAQRRVMDMLLDAIKASRKDLSSTCKAAEEADQLIKEQGLILAMTDDEEYARGEVAGFVEALPC